MHTQRPCGGFFKPGMGNAGRSGARMHTAPELGKQAVESSAAAAADFMTEGKMPTRTLTDESEGRSGETDLSRSKFMTDF